MSSSETQGRLHARRDLHRLAALGIATSALPSAALAASDAGVPTSPVTYLSNMGQDRTGVMSLLRSNIRHQQRCIAGSTGYVNYGTAVYDPGGASGYPTGTRIRIFADASGAVGTELGQLGYSSHDATSGIVTCSSVTPIEIPAGPFWAETYSGFGNTYYFRIAGTGSTGRPGWSITDTAQFGTVSYALEFSLRYEP